MSTRYPHIAIVGAAGAVGQEFLAILEQRRFSHGDGRLFGSARSAGRTLTYRGETLTIEELGEDSLRGIDLAFFSAGSETSRRYAPRAIELGCTVIDNSSEFRMEEHIPLVVPEINPDHLGWLPPDGAGIVANPNCSTIILLMALTPIHRRWGVRRAVVSTYQAISGAGAAMMEELIRQTWEVLESGVGGQSGQRSGQSPGTPVPGTPLTPSPPHPRPPALAFNVFSHNSPIGDDGCNVEETKMAVETHKIWGDPTVGVTATCIRVPVLRAHCASVNLTLDRPADDLDEVRAALTEFPGVRVVDDRAANHFPTPLEATGQDDILVGRIRHDFTQSPPGLSMFIAGDQLRKGAALNAIQIAEALREMAPR